MQQPDEFQGNCAKWEEKISEYGLYIFIYITFSKMKGQLSSCLGTETGRGEKGCEYKLLTQGSSFGKTDFFLSFFVPEHTVNITRYLLLPFL